MKIIYLNASSVRLVIYRIITVDYKDTFEFYEINEMQRQLNNQVSGNMYALQTTIKYKKFMTNR